MTKNIQQNVLRIILILLFRMILSIKSLICAPEQTQNEARHQSGWLSICTSFFFSLSRTWTNANCTESFLFVLQTQQQAYQPVVMFQLIPEKPLAVEKLVTYRKYWSVDIESFKNDLVTSSLCQPPLITFDNGNTCIWCSQTCKGL